MSRKIKYTIIAGTFLFWALSFHAQAPGYMGKKFTVGYGFYFHPSFTNAFLDYGDSPFNIQHEIFAEAVTGKRFAIGFSAHFYKYIYKNVEAVRITDYQNVPNYSHQQYEEHPSGVYTIRAQNFMIYGKAFKGNYLAPWGKYFVFGLVYTRYNTEYDPSEMKVKQQYNNNNLSTSYYTYYSDFGPPLKSYQTVDLIIGNGRTRIYGNKLVLDYGYNLGAISLVKSFAYLLFKPFAGYESPKYIESTSAARIAAMNRFNFYCKIAYLF
ncbi:MAG: hypothetical protein JNL60_18515 [Bacteroidia bacterium]|nr:hypothetical protein [Bacteroidia bacterium]